MEKLAEEGLGETQQVLRLDIEELGSSCNVLRWFSLPESLLELFELARHGLPKILQTICIYDVYGSSKILLQPLLQFLNTLFLCQLFQTNLAVIFGADQRTEKRFFPFLFRFMLEILVKIYDDFGEVVARPQLEVQVA